jgi:hypothetical protein
VKSEFMMIVSIYAKVSFDTTKNKPALGLVAKIDGKNWILLIIPIYVKVSQSFYRSIYDE